MADIILRATAADAMVRAFVADTRQMVQTAFDCHQTSPVVTAALGRLLTAGAMMGVMQKGEKDLLTLKISGDGELGMLTVTADAKGKVKGYAKNPRVDIPLKPNGKLDVSGAIGAGTLTVIKDLGLKEPYIGQTDLQTGEIAEDLTYYFMLSEQVPSSVGLGVLVDRDYRVKRAGGFIIQLMPFATDEVIDRLEQNLMGITAVTAMMEEGLQAEDILERILFGLNPEITDRIEPEFKCNCGRERISNVLQTLGEAELMSMIEDAEPVNVHCDFCNSDYEFSVEELKGLVERCRMDSSK